MIENAAAPGSLLFRVIRDKDSFIILADATDKSKPFFSRVSQETTVRDLLKLAQDDKFAKVFSRVVFQFFRERIKPVKPKRIAEAMLKEEESRTPDVLMKAFPDMGRYQFHLNEEASKNGGADLMGMNMDISSYDLTFFSELMFSLISNPNAFMATLEFFSSQETAQYVDEDSEIYMPQGQND